jgi:metallo-beta-lactamase family protein
VTGPTLRFLGAVGTVTGSRFVVAGGGGVVMVDAGLYQGLPELRRRNWEPLDLDPATVDAVVVTHAHLDHSGYLPRLVRDGFTGRIVCTAETAALVAIVLRDSAHLQAEDATYANSERFSKHRPALPLYDLGDVERTLPLIAPVAYDERVALASGIAVTLRPAGHILGSATALVEVDGSRALFSGDLGRPHHPLLLPPADPPAADVVVVESTYGDRLHPEPDDDVMAGAIRRTVRRGGSVLIPAFAVDRTELVLLELDRLRRAGRIPAVPVYVDSPMALAALEVYRAAARRPEARVRRGPAAESLLRIADVHAVRDAAESARLNEPPFPCILVSASGMATGGRVVHHLRHQLPDPRNTVLLTGYQAEGTRGRQLLDGARQLKMHGRYVPVHAEVIQVQDFSVHADREEIVAWLGRSPAPPHTLYVVHGEPRAAAALRHGVAEALHWNAVVPRYGERVRLDR